MGHGALNLVYDWQGGAARRREGLRLGHGDGHGAARTLGNGTLQFRAMLSPDPLMGRRGYPLAARRGRDGRRRRPAGRPPASARFLHGAVGAAIGLRLGRQGERLPLCRPARRAGFRPARLHAPHVDHGFARGADQPSLARFDPYQLRRGHRRAGARRRQARSLALQRPRARPASLEHRDRAARFDRAAAVLEPDAEPRRCRRAGRISSDPEQLEPGENSNRWSASAIYTRPIGATAGGRRPSPGAAGPRRQDMTPSRSKARSTGRMDPVRPRRDDRRMSRTVEARTATARPIRVGKVRLGLSPRLPRRGAPEARAGRACTPSTSSPTRSRTPMAATRRRDGVYPFEGRLIPS